MTEASAGLSLCYRSLGFSEPPFSITPDTSFFFPGSRHVAALKHLQYGLVSGGFTMVTGEVGLGKTLLCRTLLKTTPVGVQTAYIFNPPPNYTELLKFIHLDLTKKPIKSDSYGECLQQMQRTLLQFAAQGKKVAVVLDEAHRLSPKLLEGLRLLSNLETEKEKLIYLILVGQPELETILQKKQLRPLSQRINIRYKLEPFNNTETSAYINHRLAIASNGSELGFSRLALYLVHRLSGGTPRRINHICDRAMLAAFAKDKLKVGALDVFRAAKEVTGDTSVITRGAS